MPSAPTPRVLKSTVLCTPPVRSRWILPPAPSPKASPPSCKNVGAILEAAGVGFPNVFKTTCFLADMADFAAFNEVYAKYFVSKPARSCVAVKTLPKNVLCEIEAIAVKE